MNNKKKFLIPNPYPLVPNSSGFSLIELTVVMAFFMSIFAIATLSLTRTQQSATVNSKLDQVTSDIQNQQLKAMNLDTEGQGINYPYGIRFEESRYILFRGSPFNSNDPSNFAVNIDAPLSFANITIPNSSIIFDKGTGEVIGFSPTNNTFILKNSVTNDQKKFTINRIGVITSIN
ncbi:hypothetical protein A3D77_01145 [Candidatus Gottesmanbacteria bacterium RIFCSPHIGHO2_02_FULL_39_11]|uniref:General secretion pathway GspH domain-containing protein n=1 Tax=Candidatus Gottesmanbacteria bacterium RIFCSPHIGHO2_02_FULL_39_11 TaxID=1798382 RepID=A0A1F5ZJE9_9BACT|nr:MAG: hypothetical protein A3D77_01145 [Candidatus Gottesmanbacteria bacterium RIFCSPHIGHO2_02_FULL_39_11]